MILFISTKYVGVSKKRVNDTFSIITPLRDKYINFIDM